MTRGAAESEVYNLLEYSMPPQKKPSVLYIKVTTLRIFLRKIQYFTKPLSLERLLAEGVSKTKQADGEIHEDQL